MITDPLEIEKKSFEIITNELNTNHIQIPKKYEKIIKRVIHTTADFEYASLFQFSDDFLTTITQAIKTGCRIYADTNMIIAGVNKHHLAKNRCEIYTLVHEPAIREEAKAKGITRSLLGMDKACQDGQTKIFVIGNAPTALFHLYKKIEEEKVQPAAIIGVPVGFVGAGESKNQIALSKIPNLIIKGRKGGSTVAASILNAILYHYL
ncbi:MAG: precorrin-8X methylmutase [Spirochaetes bacterium]|nr:precorrin-8X methylmutase [Spirochaetota bacterium]